MNLYKHVLAFDLSSYGAALAIINQFVDDENIKVFEVSPCGQAAILILVAKEINLLHIVKAETDSIFKSQILTSLLIENAHADLFPAYLSQNKSKLNKSLIILEGSSVAEGLFLADKLLVDKNILVDFRVIRTFPKNVIITFSAETKSSPIYLNGLDFKTTYIENIQPCLKSFYEI